MALVEHTLRPVTRHLVPLVYYHRSYSLYPIMMRILVVLNPVAGRTQVESVKRALHQYFYGHQSIQLELYETTGKEVVADIVNEAIDGGIGGVFAAGGDGTVSAVADALAETGIPLGIIPTGTTNVLAQELGIPLNIDKACRLLAGPTTTRSIDTLQQGDRHFVLSVGIGLSALAIEGTSREGKRRFGPLAYIWSILNTVAGVQPHVFTIVSDGRKRKIRAADVLLANVSTITGPLRWGPHIKPDDGRIDICVMRAKNILDVVGVGLDIVVPGRPRKNRNLVYWQAFHTVLVFGEEPLLVQGDGESLGRMPLEVVLAPKSVQVFVGSQEGNGRRSLRLPLLSNNL